ncbi:MAG: hypothetical protein GX238_02055 [Epulopiscium sp.]|nr:hypothetical protein [Candidatus Epulonipiscium sp.]
MIALTILDLRLFMQELLKGSIFHPFEVRNVEIQTFTTFQISGQLHKDFFLIEEQELLQRNYALWKEIQPFVFQMVKGSRLPKKLKLVLSFPKEEWHNVLPLEQQKQTSALFLNLLYEHPKMTCTTGVALPSFTLDKTVEHLWDEFIQSFLQQHQLGVEKIFS